MASMYFSESLPWFIDVSVQLELDSSWKMHFSSSPYIFCTHKVHSISKRGLNLIHHSHNCQIHSDECVKQCTTSLKMRHNRELQWDCVGFTWDGPWTANTSNTFTVLYWSWYTYEIKIHIKYIHCHKLGIEMHHYGCATYFGNGIYRGRNLVNFSMFIHCIH